MKKEKKRYHLQKLPVEVAARLKAPLGVGPRQAKVVPGLHLVQRLDDQRADNGRKVGGKVKVGVEALRQLLRRQAKVGGPC